MVAPVSNFLEMGMYTPAEAAMYARISTRMMSRWVHGDASGAAAIRAQVPDAPDKTVTFLDLVQSMAIRAIRDKHDVPLQKIRETIEYAAEQGIEYPFARQHTTFLWNDDIHLQVKGFELLQASGRQKGQGTMRKVVEMYLDDLTFNADGLADTYTPLAIGKVRIVMRPGFHFGEPIVESCGYTAWTLWEACISEGSVEAAAAAYGVTEAEVRVAFKYIDSIRPRTAA